MMSSRIFSRITPLWGMLSLLLLLAACGGGSGGNTDPPGALPALQVEAEAGDARITLTWNMTEYPQATTFNLCVATENIDDMDSCSLLAGGDYQNDVTSPYSVSGLQNGERYYLRVEASAEGYEPELSSLLSVIPHGQASAIPGRTAIEVINYGDAGYIEPTDIIALNEKAIIYYKSWDQSYDKRSKFTVADGINPPIEIVVGDGDSGSYTELHLTENLLSLESRMVNGKRYFRASNSGGINDLWVTDGTQQGTQRVVEGQALGLFRFQDIAAAGEQIAFVGGGKLYFLSESELGGAVPVAEGITAHDGSIRPYLVPYEGGAGDDYFLLSGYSSGVRQIYRVDTQDGQAEPLHMTGETGPNTGELGAYNLTIVNDALYFIAGDEQSDNQARTIWRMDLGGTGVEPASVERLFDPSNSAKNIANPLNLHMVGDSIYFGVMPWTDPAGYNTTTCRLMAASVLNYQEVSSDDFHCQHDFGYPFVTLNEQLLLQSPTEPGPYRNWWLVGSSPDIVMVDEEPLAAPILAVHSEASARSAAAAGTGGWLVNNEQDRLVHIDGESLSTFVATAEGGAELNAINTLTNVNENLWFTACVKPATSNCRGVWWVPPEQDGVGGGD